MFEIHEETFDWAGRPLSLQTGRMARQADGAVLVSYGETSVLATVCAERSMKPGQDFFPLTVNYQEKYYAAGRIPGGYFKREGRPTEKETLTSRLIDRPIRPLFATGFKNEVQVIATVLSYDMENDPDIVAMIGASAALTLSGVPFLGPIGGARVGLIDGAYVLNPTMEQMADTRLDLIVAGTNDAVMMVESEADELSEQEMLSAVMYGHQGFQPVIDAIIRLAMKAAKDPWDFKPEDFADEKKAVRRSAGPGLRKAYGIADKTARRDAIEDVRQKLAEKFLATEDNQDGMDETVFKTVFKAIESEVVRGSVIKTGKRIDGRGLADVRQIENAVGVLPRTHGSALFTRGETQALVVTTLGTGDDEQFVDTLDGTGKSSFLLHYNFPPFSVGETGRMGGPGRREIGHGKLAWRALNAVMPKKEEFPYTIRLVSEILESNGSSSMATVCAGSLALMDAGAPIRRPVSGIAMGLIKEEDGSFAVLSDILGDEDHLGDMDFKVAGTEAGVTSLQMDIKIAGITEDIMRQALDQAKDGRLHILEEMGKALAETRTELGAYAPRIETIQIKQEKIREVIGSGGKVIREIVETTGAKVDINDDGLIKIASNDAESIEKAKEWILGIAADPEIGKIYTGTVVKVVEFGAFVNFFGPRDGLVHVSEIAKERVKAVSDYLKEGDTVKVKLLGFDDRGKVRLSMKMVDQETGEELSAEAGA